MSNMERLARLFFENPLYVYVALAFVELVLAVIWHERRTRKLAEMLIIPPLLAVLVFVVSWRVVTDRERIISAAEEIALDVQAGKLDAARRYLAEEYNGFGHDRDGALAAAARAQGTYGIEKVRLTKMNVEMDDHAATMEVTTIVTIASAGPVSILWKVDWAKKPAGWRIVHVQTPDTTLGFF